MHSVVDKSQVKEAQRILGRARAKACKQLPFMTDVIYALIPWACKLPPGAVGMAVSKDGVLFYDPKVVVEDWVLDDVVTGLIHEAEHILRRHFQRANSRNLSAKEIPVWQDSVDAELGDDLEAMKLKLLASDITPARLGLQNGSTAELYFEELRKRPGKGGGGKGSGGAPGASGAPGQGKSSGRGCCGSGAGNPLPNEEQLGGPKLVPSEREVQLETMREEVADAIVNHAKSQGTVPGNLKRWAEEHRANRTKTIPWDKQLQAHARHAVAWKRGQTDATYTRSNRRQGGLGFGVGRPIMSANVSPIAEIALCADTSMSMSGNEFREILDEAEAILQTAGGKVTFVAIDAAVHVNKKMTSVAQMQRNLLGGGGTDFRPAFDALKKNNPKPSIVVYATDGYGSYPDLPPSWCKVIWLMTTMHQPPWGTVIRLPMASTRPSFNY